MVIHLAFGMYLTSTYYVALLSFQIFELITKFQIYWNKNQMTHLGLLKIHKIFSIIGFVCLENLDFHLYKKSLCFLFYSIWQGFCFVIRWEIKMCHLTSKKLNNKNTNINFKGLKINAHEMKKLLMLMYSFSCCVDIVI